MAQQPDGTWVNSIVEIKQYLTTPGDPLASKEFQDFWNSLTQAEKDEFKRAELK